MTSVLSDPDSTARISRADLFRDDEAPDPNSTARISRAELFRDDD